MMTENKTHGSGKKKFVIIPVIFSMILTVSIINQPLSANPKIEKLPQEQKSEPIVQDISGNNDITLIGKGEQDAVNEKVKAGLSEEKVAVKTKVPELQINESTLIAPEDTTPSNNLLAAISPTRMNVFYLGVDNPVSIGVTGADMDEIDVTIDNGSIFGENGNYIVRVRKTGLATITVKAGDKIVSETVFRVKRIPDPLAMVGNTRGGYITKEQLINAKGVRVVLINFDWDMEFEIVSFNISAQAEGGFVRDAKANGNTFTNAQLEIINGAPAGRKIYIEDIKAKGPDGAIRALGSLTYLIKE